MTVPTASIPIAPIQTPERSQALDVLRGVAILGILLMNIQNFSMIGAAYFNPTAFGDLSGVNHWAWRLSHLFADQKFLTIFSILFGAGIVLMAGRVEARGGSAARLHYRRMLGLLVLGLLHAYLFWAGDILVVYSLAALLVFLFRRRTPRTLLILGLVAVAIPSVYSVLVDWSMPYWPPESIEGMMAFWAPDAEQVRAEVAAYQGSWLAQMEFRAPTAVFIHTFVFLTSLGWRSGGLMLIGMALYKWGVLTANRSSAMYVRMVVAGFVIGFPLIAYGTVRNFAAGWSLDYSFFIGSQFNYWGAPLVSLAYVGIVMLAWKSGRFGVIARPLAAVGRTALSNYVLQTLICTTIFYGHGFGLFGRVDRVAQISIVVGVWIVQLFLSSLWLRRFRYGPLEWLWRSWTYRQKQPMRVVADFGITKPG